MEIDDTTQALASIADPSSDFAVSTDALDKAQLDSDAFLKLFLAQLENQDPLNPQDASQMSAQLAQFSQLEQSIRSTDQLTGVNLRLDELISASTLRQQSSLDPVSLIGHNVDIELNRLQVPSTGESARLDIDVNTSSGEFLLVEAFDANGESVGVAVASRRDDAGETLPLEQGRYQFGFRYGEPKIGFPDGTADDLAFQPFSQDESGNVVLEEGDSARFNPGASYTFETRLAGTIAGTPFSEPLTPTTTGNVDSVRIIEGLPVLRVAGQDIDPTQIIRIR